MSRKPYVFRPSLEQLRDMKDLSPKQKLDWLEEAHQLVAAFVSPSDLERWRRIASASPASPDLISDK